MVSSPLPAAGSLRCASQTCFLQLCTCSCRCSGGSGGSTMGPPCNYPNHSLLCLPARAQGCFLGPPGKTDVLPWAASSGSTFEAVPAGTGAIYLRCHQVPGGQDPAGTRVQLLPSEATTGLQLVLRSRLIPHFARGFWLLTSRRQAWGEHGSGRGQVETGAAAAAAPAPGSLQEAGSKMPPEPAE